MSVRDFKTSEQSYVQCLYRVKTDRAKPADIDRIKSYESMCRATIKSVTVKSFENDFGCLHSSGAFHDSSQTRKMVKVHGSNSRQELYLQQLAVIAKGDQVAHVLEKKPSILDTIEFNGISKKALTHECSHSCHDTVCMNPDHVLVRSRSENKSQNYCRAFMVGGKKFSTCSHNPQCMLAAVPIIPYTGGAPSV